MAKCKNPILPGFYPDPSICRVGNKYYIVNSTFTYFPGVPIFESENLIEWKQIGNVLDRNSQLPLEKAGHSRGIFAPTIRYNDGVWYMITTNISGGGNFIVTAEKPEGPWSEPYFLDGAIGIDPSLFFDDDGKCYYTGTRENPTGATYNGDWEIWTQELDLKTMKLVGDAPKLWKGSQVNVIWPEGPHIYKKDGYYYLLHAEGGTGSDHCIAVARSKSIFGPYENNPKNPIITHRHLGEKYPVTNVGHGDLVETPNGDWYMVLLASRPIGKSSNLGRETFLSKVTWENDWPIVNAGVGVLEEVFDIECDVKDDINKKFIFSCNFDEKKLPLNFISLRNPKDDFYFIDDNNLLNLKCQKLKLGDEDSISYLAVRQQHWNFVAKTKLLMDNLDVCKAGLVLMQNDEYNIEYVVEVKENKRNLKVLKHLNNQVELLQEKEIAEKNDLEIIIKANGLAANFYFVENEKEILLLENISLEEMCTEIAGGFVGCTVGMYATGDDKSYAKFKSFEYMEL